MLFKEVPAVVQKCVNPACGDPFLYFRGGKIYRIDRRDGMPRMQRAREQGKPEHFWLCGRCSVKLTVILLADGSVAVAESCRPQERESSRVPGRSRPAEHTPRILVLDAELKTLGFIEQMLEDSGSRAITTTSVVEAISLLTTGFFDCFIAIDRPAPSYAAAILSTLAVARSHCKSCFCWNSQNVRQLCNDFVEEAMTWKLEADHGDQEVYDTVNETCPRSEQAGAAA